MNKSSSQAISLALISGAFWGLPFVVPLLLSPLSPIMVTIGRFLFFFIASLWGARATLADFKTISVRQKFGVVLLSAAGFWFYSFLLFSALPRTGGVIATLIIGLLPITIPIYARDYLSRSAKFKGGLLIIVLGLVTLVIEKWNSITYSNQSFTPYIALLFALFSWTIYSVENSKFLKSTQALRPEQVSQIMGLVSFPCLLLLLAPFLRATDVTILYNPNLLFKFILGSAALGWGASFFANRLWNRASAQLPNSLMGPLMISETAAGLIYSFSFEKRLPTFLEGLSLLLFALGVGVCLKRSKKA